ncbi:CubicO group peptidase (beta-lactamase class C family) [Chitinophaga dinghuensis]|uniref:CubicO group peptidase (Beta-lactamase class C family) n=1 Tax=Chitinophaga dinghuensis TaxID=1539050 RepID=A0A327VSF3_9BACT|nr:serine hydrolase domain-containing protein [Chitinophaga dinghuensis]RAJ77496.1 CubicO group peptidase (beta-lactamase class C family) [Chitinophaga dinghuensis]
MRPYFLLLFTVMLLPFFALAQTDFKQLDQWLDKNAPIMGGRAYLVLYKDGKIVYSRSAGQLNGRQKMGLRMMGRMFGQSPDLTPFTIHSKIPVASCSKWLSAALVMTFVDEGKLHLADTVGTWLPVLSQHGKGNITISQCLSHLTGIKAPPIREGFKEQARMGSMDEVIANIATLDMEGKPGTVFHYSSIGLQIAAAIIEKISGSDFRTLFKNRISIPLNMPDTDFGDAAVPEPAGGGNSTPEDYMHFLTMILHKGEYEGKRILSEESVAVMQVNRITPDIRIAFSPAGANQFGYGYGEWTIGTHTVTSPGLFGSFPWVNKEKHYAGFLLTFYFQQEGRNERYIALEQLADQTLR